MSAKYLEELWTLIVAIDRFLALLLGLPYGCSDVQCDLNNEPTDDLEERYLRKISSVTAEIIDWNSAPPNFAYTQDRYSQALVMSNKIDEYAVMMPEEWWTTPTSAVQGEDSTLGFGRCRDAAFDRLMSQVW